MRTTRALERERAASRVIADLRGVGVSRGRTVRLPNRRARDAPRRHVLRPRARAQRNEDASASSAFDDARVAAVLARVASVKAEATRSTKKNISARRPRRGRARRGRARRWIGRTSRDVRADDASSHRASADAAAGAKRHRRTVSTSAAVSATREESARRERSSKSGSCTMKRWNCTKRRDTLNNRRGTGWW